MNPKSYNATGIILAALGLVALAFPCFAAKDNQIVNRKSGYANVPGFGGPSSVGEELKEDDREEGYRFDGLHTVLSPYFSWKEMIKEKYGLAFSFDYSLLYQIANESAGDEDKAAGGIFRFFGSWTVLDRGGNNPGSIVYKIENRHRLGTDIAPQTLGFEIGYVGAPGAQFGDTDWMLSNLHWLQIIDDKRLKFVVGIIDPTDYLNVYALVDPLTTFSNLAFLTEATIPAPSQGLAQQPAGFLLTTYTCWEAFTMPMEIQRNPKTVSSLFLMIMNTSSKSRSAGYHHMSGNS